MCLQQRARVGEVLLYEKKYDDVCPFIPAMYSKLDQVTPP